MRAHGAPHRSTGPQSCAGDSRPELASCHADRHPGLPLTRVQVRLAALLPVAGRSASPGCGRHNRTRVHPRPPRPGGRLTHPRVSGPRAHTPGGFRTRSYVAQSPTPVFMQCGRLGCSMVDHQDEPPTDAELVAAALRTLDPTPQWRSCTGGIVSRPSRTRTPASVIRGAPRISPRRSSPARCERPDPAAVPRSPGARLCSPSSDAPLPAGQAQPAAPSCPTTGATAAEASSGRRCRSRRRRATAACATAPAVGAPRLSQRHPAVAPERRQHRRRHGPVPNHGGRAAVPHRSPLGHERRRQLSSARRTPRRRALARDAVRHAHPVGRGMPPPERGAPVVLTCNCYGAVRLCCLVDGRASASGAPSHLRQLVGVTHGLSVEEFHRLPWLSPATGDEWKTPVQLLLGSRPLQQPLFDAWLGTCGRKARLELFGLLCRRPLPRRS